MLVASLLLDFVFLRNNSFAANDKKLAFSWELGFAFYSLPSTKKINIASIFRRSVLTLHLLKTFLAENDGEI